MKALVFTFATGIAIFGASSSFAHKAKSSHRITGYVAHGINVYNNQFIVDYSDASPMVSWLNPAEPIKEIGIFSPGADNADPINENTDRSLPVATTDGYVNFFNPGGQFDSNLLN